MSLLEIVFNVNSCFALISIILLILSEVSSSKYGISRLNIHYKKFKIGALIISSIFLVLLIIQTIQINS